MNKKQDTLIYVWDAYCGWCYGFSKSINTFYKKHPELSLNVLSGGLFVDDKKLSIKSFPHIPQANKRISELTGAEFGFSYESLLSEGNFVLDSEAAAIGFSTLRSLAPERSLEFTSAIQHAFYYDGKSLSAPETYRDIAIAYNLNPELVVEQFEKEEILQDVYNDFKKVQELGIHSYPTLLLKRGENYIPIGGGAMTADKIEARLQDIYS
ncbi:DsbA family protein [Priestia sp. JV24]|uniref:DsbA family protein n=1 Tax=Priestia TaxID=2800373 RepID=UPI0021D688F5|nr:MULTISPECIES: DsbA family protein [Priestia]MCU7711352.1 DsbA family protein [Priestia megaterium]MCW1045933.1 DsbA family protein [Priestia sp. JV24]